MRAFIQQSEEVNCSCFDTSPKTNRRIFLSDSNSMSYKKQSLSSFRNQSEEVKHKKKSLKKERQSSIHSQRDLKRQDQSFFDDLPMNSNKLIPHSQKAINLQQKQSNYSFLQFSKVQQLKNQKFKQSNNLRPNRGYKNSIIKQPIQISNGLDYYQSIEAKRNQQYEVQINQEFEKDLQEFRINMQKLKIQQKQKGKMTFSQRQSHPKQDVNKVMPFSDIVRKSSRKTSIKTPQKASSYRESNVSEKRRQSIAKKKKNTMIPKQIESENESNQSEASEFIGRGWGEGSVNRQEDFQQTTGGKGNQTIKTETMVTRQSNIRNSEIKTINDQQSHILTSARSQNFTAFPFGQNKYGQAGLSYQHISDLHGQKNSHAKIHF